MVSSQRSPRLRFSIRSLLILTALFCIFAAWHGRRAQREREAVAGILAAGGTLIYDYQVDEKFVLKSAPSPPGPKWLRRLIGEELFTDVVYVQLANDEAIQEGLFHLRSLPSLRILELKGTGLSDDDLKHVAGLENLERLEIFESSIQGPGLVHIAGNGILERLRIENSPLGDDGLSHLRGLQSLTALELDHTRVGNNGLFHLRNLDRLKWLNLSYTRVTDDGLAHLSALGNLQALEIVGTGLKGDGLHHLKQISNLIELVIPHEAVESADYDALQQALPNLAISPGR